MISFDLLEVRFAAGLTVRARRTLVEGGGLGDPGAQALDAGYIHAHVGDLGVVTEVLDDLAVVLFEADDGYAYTLECDAHDVLLVPEGVDPGVPFPQANQLPAVLDLVRQLCGPHPVDLSHHSRSERRGVLYYGNAARTLGWLHREDGFLVPTALGRHVIESGDDTARAAVWGALCLTPVFDVALSHLATTGVVPYKDWIAARIAALGYSHSTAARRASTVVAWLTWLTTECRPFRRQVA